MLPCLPLPFNKRCPIHGNCLICIWWGSTNAICYKQCIYLPCLLFILQQNIRFQHGSWVPHSLLTCCLLIYDALSSDAIKEVEFKDGQVVDRRWIIHHFDFGLFRFFGFLDDFGMPTPRPGSLATRRHNYESDIQWAFYSGYLCCHGFKAQVVYIPIGIIGLLFSVYYQKLA